MTSRAPLLFVGCGLNLKCLVLYGASRSKCVCSMVAFRQAGGGGFFFLFFYLYRRVASLLSQVETISHSKYFFYVAL